MSKNIIDGLNQEQIRAVNHSKGPLLIFAGAGSGKTRVIVHRVANLIESGVRPDEILCLTFTNKAAAEMKLRLKHLLGVESVNVWAGTFHAFGAWFLRREASHAGYPRSFIIYDAADQRSLIGRCIKDLHLKKERGTDSSIAWLISLGKDTMQSIGDIPHELLIDPEPVAELYEKRKQEYGALDFGDLLLLPSRILSEVPGMRERYNARIRYVLVDEYQDTNMAQYTMLMQLVGEESNICVVGDDDQSIYGWRGAEVGNILRFKDDFPEAKVITLERNYRSTERILEAASSLIANNRYRAPKKIRSTISGGEDVWIEEFSSDENEAQGVAYTIERLIEDGVNPRNIGVFYRINALSRVIEETFVRRQIPYAVYGGMRFYERREIRDLLAYLRLIAHPEDEEALGRIINTPSRGIGLKTLAALRAYAATQSLPTLSVLDQALEEGIVKGSGARGVQAFSEMMKRLASLAGYMDVADLFRAIMQHSGLQEALKNEIDGHDRLTNISELIASSEGQSDLAAYLEEKALISEIDTVQDEDRVSVMTLHMSKGLEFDHVFIMGIEEGLLPHSRSMDSAVDIEEERRLLYVGITRARRRAMLSWSRVRALYGRETFQVPSGFLSEIVIPRT